MATVGSILVKLGLQSASFTKGIDEATKKTDSLRTSMRGLKEAGEILRGAGAIAGVTMLGRALNDTTKKIEEMWAAFGRGALEGKEALADVLKSLPVVGQLGEGLARVWEMALGRAEEVERLQAAITAQQSQISRTEKALALLAQAKRVSESSRLKVDTAERLSGKEGVQREFAELEIERQARIGELQAAREEALRGTAIVSVRKRIAAEYNSAIEAENRAFAIRRAELLDKEREQNRKELEETERKAKELGDALDSFFAPIERAEIERIESATDDALAGFFGPIERAAELAANTRGTQEARSQRFAFAYAGSGSSRNPVEEYVRQQTELQRAQLETQRRTLEVLTHGAPVVDF